MFEPSQVWWRHLFAVLLAAGGISLAASPAAAGPWVNDPGEIYAKLAGERFQSDKNFDVDGNLVEAMPAYSHWGARGYVELGVAPRLGIAATAPLVRATNTRPNGETFHETGFGDLDVRLDGQIIEKPCALAGSVQGRIPLYDGMVQSGDQSTAAMSRTGDDRFVPLLGDGSFELTPLLAAGCPLPRSGWATLRAGPNFRFSGFGNGLNWGASAGLYLWPERLAVALRASGRERFSTENDRPTKSFRNLGGGVLFDLTTSVALEGSVSYTPSGAFVARGWSGSLGVSYAGALFQNPFD